MDEKKMDRRRFLKVTGCGAAIALVGGGCSLAKNAEAKCPYGKVNDPYPGECGRYVDSNGNGICDLSESSTTSAKSIITSTPAAQATQIPVQTDSAAPTDVTVQQVACNRGCSFPGDCGSYVDNNGNGICDLSEAAVVGTATSTATVPATQTPSSSSPPQATATSSGVTAQQIACNRGCSFPGECGRYVDNNGNGKCDLSELSTNSGAGVPAIQVPNSSAGSAGVQQAACNRACRYPGHCGRFIDSDGSGICDQAEGIAAAGTGSGGKPGGRRPH
ncbi:MAG TPA: hypothetical protein VHP83_13105 [Aggregatilineaceae bacterium]|nr:hypothetical protein [Aggregatilineaceae bacterium]